MTVALVAIWAIVGVLWAPLGALIWWHAARTRMVITRYDLLMLILCLLFGPLVWVIATATDWDWDQPVWRKKPPS